MEWLLQFEKLNALIGFISVIGTALAAVLRMLWVGKKRVEALFQSQEAMQKSIDEIVTQIRPNGGQSMVDVLHINHRKTEENTSLINDIMHAIDRLAAYQWSFAETLTEKPVWEADVAGKIIRVNLAYSRLVERTVSELVGHGWENVIHPIDRARVFAEWNDAVARKRNFETTFRILTRNQKQFAITAVAQPVFTSKQALVSFVGRFDDIKEIP